MSRKAPAVMASKTRGGSIPGRSREYYNLSLYVTDLAPRCAVAFENLRRICQRHLRGRYTIKVVDLLDHPERAKADQIVAIPTVVRESPPPVRRVIGDLSSFERVLGGLDLQPCG